MILPEANYESASIKSSLVARQHVKAVRSLSNNRSNSNQRGVTINNLFPE
jgi:hypothetical protein